MILPLGPPDKNSRVRILDKLFWQTEFKTLRDRSPGATGFVDFVNDVAELTIGYTHAEIVDFLIELQKNAKNSGNDQEDRNERVVPLWKIRSEKAPTALGAREGFSWRAFSDDAQRYARGTEEPRRSAEYWQEPTLPSP
jgi:hypothetical protein